MNTSHAAEELKQAVMVASAREEVRQRVHEIYVSLQREIDQRRPRCDASGKCCHFDEYGHRLYVTTLELATFIHELEPVPVGRRGLVVLDVKRESGGCVFQEQRLCGVHAIRPFGCRIFFCDASAAQWQQEQYERFHGELKKAHEQLGVDYYYVEWRQALDFLGLGVGIKDEL